MIAWFQSFDRADDRRREEGNWFHHEARAGVGTIDLMNEAEEIRREPPQEGRLERREVVGVRVAGFFD